MGDTTGFYEKMREQFEEDILAHMKIWQTLTRKLAHYENHKKFLLSCKNQNIFPQHIQQTSKCIQSIMIDSRNPFTSKCNSIVYNFKKKILSLEVSYTHWKINTFRKELHNASTFVRAGVPSQISNIFEARQKTFYKNLYNKIRIRQMKKFKLLKNRGGVMWNGDSTIDEKWFVNLTSVKFPPQVKYLLSLGDKFNLPYFRTLPIQQLLIDVEYALFRFDDDSLITEKRNHIINWVTNFLNSSPRYKSDQHKHLLSCVKSCRSFLKSHKDIMILRADKGNVTVSMLKSDYRSRAMLMLDDRTTYREINSDPTTSIQNKLNKFITNLLKSDHIDENNSRFLKCNNGICPKMYFLPKIHKQDYPLRPVVSYVGSPLYNLSKFLAKLLDHIFERDERYIKDSFEFVDSLKNILVPKGYILVSLDVTSLFTNIPISLAIELIKKYWVRVEQHTRLNLAEFLRLFELCVDNSFFKFEEKIYKQVFGLGMGNCLAPVVSDIVMSELQDSCLGALPFSVPVFKRYVDDIFTIIPSDKTNVILDTFNRFHEKLQFTIEVEKEQSLPFLDVLVIRENDGIITNWYQKPTFSERYLNFNSDHPFSHKLNVINNLKKRALLLSNQKFHEENISKIRIFMLKNGYPKKLIEKILRRDIYSIRNDEPESNERMYLKIPYIRGLSEKVKKILERGNRNINVSQKPENTNRRFYSKLKAMTPKDETTDVVYRIRCRDCDGVYIGQTGRYLRTRIQEHIRDVRNIHDITKKKKENNTALAEHSSKELHEFNFNEVEIIGRQNILKKRLLHEMIEIKKEKNSINKRSDIENLNSAYFNIINKL